MTSTLHLYNTLHRNKALFSPISPPHVGMYVCGITAYDYCHIGHARVMVVFDVISRWLRHSGYQLTYVRNITDIDDKIIRRAAENGESIKTLTTRFIKAMHEDEHALGVLAPDYEPRATDHIAPMIDMIEKLLKKGFAYRTQNGDICYAVRQFARYGQLSGKSTDELRAGERVSLNDNKHDPLDFILWKAAKPNEPTWQAPFGAGRPGWHIECSAMSQVHLGTHFDIHGGGQDLQFPHHDNEIAQSEAAHQSTFVNVWLHNGFVTIDQEKMAKSLGNFQTIRDILQQWPAEVLRFFLLRSHYRSPLSFSQSNLLDAKAALTRLYQCLRGQEADFLSIDRTHTAIDWDYPEARAFKSAMDDDINTPIALAALFELVKKINRKHDTKAVKMLYLLSGVLGLLQQEPHTYFTQNTTHTNMEHTLSDRRIEELIQERNLYRSSQNFSEADRIREELMEKGIILDDSPAGTTWKRL